MLRRIRLRKFVRNFSKVVDVVAAVDAVVPELIPGDWNALRKFAKGKVDTHRRTKAEIVSDLVKLGYRNE